MTASQIRIPGISKSVAIERFVQWTEYEGQRQVLVAGVGKRGGQIGIALGNISLRHSAGYEVVVEFPDGKQESFAPMSLFPVTE